jgi:addiction module RelE/StbE family toxin
MELQLTPETEAKLNELARRTHRGTDELLQEAVDHLLTYNEWFERKVNGSLAAAERGETVPDEDVRAWIGATGTLLMRLEWSERAVADLKAISEYIEQDRNLQTANRVTRTIYDALQSLRRMPYRGRYGRLENTRELVIAGLPWIAVYRVAGERVLILNILHGAPEVAVRAGEKLRGDPTHNRRKRPLQAGPDVRQIQIETRYRPFSGDFENARSRLGARLSRPVNVHGPLIAIDQPAQFDTRPHPLLHLFLSGLEAIRG